MNYILAIEIDGNTHDYNFENDELRQKKLENLEITFIRFSDWDVKRNMNDVLRALEFVISEIEKKKRYVEESKNIPLAPFKGGNQGSSASKGI